MLKEQINNLKQTFKKEFGEVPKIMVDINFHKFKEREKSEEVIAKIAKKFNAVYDEKNLSDRVNYFEVVLDENITVTSFYEKEDK